MSYQWVNLFEIAKLSGLVYLEAFVDKENQAIAWISRSEVAEPYSYDCYAFSPTDQFISTRGTWKDARWAIQGAVAGFASTQGVPLEQLSKVAQQRWEILPDSNGAVVVKVNHEATGYGRLYNLLKMA